MTDSPRLRDAVTSHPVLAPYRVAALGDRPLRRRLLSAGFVLFVTLYGMIYAFVAPYLMVPLAMPILILAAITIWALPDNAIRPPVRLLHGLFFGFFIVLIEWPNYLAVALPGLPWITLVRLFGFPLAAVLLISVSGSQSFRTRLGKGLSATPWFWRLFLAFIGIQILSLGFSNLFSLSVDNLVAAQFNWTSVYFAAVYIFMDRKMIPRMGVLLWLLTIPVSLIALAEWREGHVIWAGHIPPLLKVNNPDVAIILAGHVRAGTDEYRVQSTFSTSLGLAEFLALALPFVIYFVIAGFNRVIRGLAGLTIPLILGAIFVSGSRLGVIGAFLTLLIYVLMFGLLRWKSRRSDLVGPAVVMAYPAIFAAFMTASLFIGRLRRLVWGGGETEDSTQARFGQWGSGMPKVLSHPWGYGIARGGDALQWYTPGGQLTIDTYYLDVLLEYGVVGFVVYFGMILSVLGSLMKSVFAAWRSGLELGFAVPVMIALVNFLVIKSVFAQEDNHPLVFMSLGMATAIIYHVRQTADEPAEPASDVAPTGPRARLAPT